MRINVPAAGDASGASKPKSSELSCDGSDGIAAATGDVSLDTLCNGRLRIAQSRSGYRFSLDAILLAGFATAKQNDRIADLGTGNGVIPLLLAQGHPSTTVLGIEVQEALAERARKNIRLNELGERVTIALGDVRAIDRIAPRGAFTVVVCNPPYRKASSGRLSPNSERRIARHEIMGTIDDFVKAGCYLLAAKGRMAVVYPAGRCVDLLSALRRAGIEPKRLKAVHSSSAVEASLILAEGVKGARSGITLLPPLIVYGPDGSYSREVATMLRG
jgi:tRNA1Val (adenine37-N6)-methyltransferase